MTIRLDLKRGQKMTGVTKGGVIYFVPEKPLEALRGFLKGMDTKALEKMRKDDVAH